MDIAHNLDTFANSFLTDCPKKMISKACRRIQKNENIFRASRKIVMFQGSVN